MGAYALHCLLAISTLHDCTFITGNCRSCATLGLPSRSVHVTLCVTLLYTSYEMLGHFYCSILVLLRMFQWIFDCVLERESQFWSTLHQYSFIIEFVAV